MSYAEIKKAVNSDLSLPLNELIANVNDALIEQLADPLVLYATATGAITVPRNAKLRVNAIGQGGTGDGGNYYDGNPGGKGGGTAIDERMYKKGDVINIDITSARTIATCDNTGLNMTSEAGIGQTDGGNATGGNIANYEGGNGGVADVSTSAHNGSPSDGCGGGGGGWNTQASNKLGGAGGKGGVSGGNASSARGTGSNTNPANGGDGGLFGGVGGSTSNNSKAGKGGDGRILGGKGGNSSGNNAGDGGDGAIGGDGGNSTTSSGSTRGGNGGNSTIFNGGKGGDTTSSTGTGGYGGNNLFGSGSAASGNKGGDGSRGIVPSTKYPPKANYGGGNYIAGLQGLPLIYIEEVVSL